MIFRVESGARYALGIELPFILSKQSVADWAHTHGFTAVSVRDRGAPLPYDPKRAPGGYSDDWDTVVEATYSGTDSSIDAPGRPAWVLRLEKKKSPSRPSKTPRLRRTRSRAPSSKS